MRQGIRTRLLALAATAGVAATLGAGAAWASPQNTLPHIKGSKYCETITRPADYTLYGYAKGTTCATLKAFVKRCEAAPGLQGWKLRLTNQGEILTKGTKTLDLEIAGGSPLCITRALT